MEKIEAVRKIVADCPDIKLLNSAISENDINVDWTDENPTDYGVMVYGDSETAEKKYIGGNVEKTYVFNTALFVRLYTETQVNMLQNSVFFEKFARYIRKLTKDETFPTLEDNEIVTKLEAAQGQLYGADEGNESGLYSIQVNMTYKKEHLPEITGVPKGHSIFYNAE